MSIRSIGNGWAAATALLVLTATSVYAQSGCLAPGIGAAPIVKGWALRSSPA